MLFAGLGGLLFFVGVVWLVITAIQTGQTTGEKALWAVVNLFCQPVSGIIFYIVRKQGLIPLILVILGVILGGYGWTTSMGEVLEQMPR